MTPVKPTEEPAPASKAPPVHTDVTRSAFDELAEDGAIGKQTLALLVRSAIRVANRKGFPPPSGHERWTPAAASEWLHDEFFPRKGFELPIRLRAEAADEASLRRLLERSAHRVLQDQAKATPVGLMIERMRTFLPRIDGVVDFRECYGAEAWTLMSSGDAIFPGDWRDLLSDPALRAVEPLDELNSAGPATQANLRRLVEASEVLLRRAEGALRAADLAHALVELFELDDPAFWPLLDLLEDREEDEREVGLPTRDGLELGALELAHLAADQLLQELTYEDRLLIVWMDQPLALIRIAIPSMVVTYPKIAALKKKLATIHTAHEPPSGSWDVVISRCDKEAQIKLARPDHVGGDQ